MATILIVDDLSASRKFLVTLLRSEGHRLIEAADGREGLAAARADPPDLVITDVLMPVMDGYEFVRQLRLEPALGGIPVLFCTAPYGAREARAVARSGGAVGVLAKPAAPGEVLKVVGRALAGQLQAEMPDATSRTPELDHQQLGLLSHGGVERTGDLRAANARLRALINIGLEIASERDADRLLQRVCAAAHDLFGATYVTLGLLERNGRTVERVVACGTDAAGGLNAGDTVPGILGTVVAERRTMRGDNPGGHPAALQLPAVHPAIETFLAAPIASPLQVYGWICLVGNEGRTFTEDDEHQMMALSAQVGRIYEHLSGRASAPIAAGLPARNHAVEAPGVAADRTRFALETAGVGIWDMDCAAGTLQWSTATEAQYGLQPGTFGGTFEAFTKQVHPDDRASVLHTVARVRKSGTDFSMQNRSIWPDGTVRWLSCQGRIWRDEQGDPVRAVGISLDVTERRTLEAQYLQAQKMEAVGRLAGGLAHDFNNLVTGILGFCELLLADLKPNDPRRADIAEIRKAGESAADLTRHLLAFSRSGIAAPTQLDLNVVVADLQAMLARLIGDDVTVMLGLRSVLGPVKADRGQVEQIVMNLAVNARDAMPDGGTLRIETANVDLDEHYATTHRGVKPGPYVALTISDTGAGMTRQVQARLFEPFFTTKEVGKGTGLGLASVHGIVTRSGGSVDVSSEVGKGSTFTVYFPRADPAVAVAAVPAVAPPGAGAETVLVVDDADGLRELTRRLLQRQGYSVLVARNADEAIRLFKLNSSIDVLLTDVVMPGGSGPELSRQLLDQRPALRVIYMSGYTEDAIAHHGVLGPGTAFLHKPFTSESLGRKLREVLDR